MDSKLQAESSNQVKISFLNDSKQTMSSLFPPAANQKFEEDEISKKAIKLLIEILDTLKELYINFSKFIDQEKPKSEPSSTKKKLEIIDSSQNDSMYEDIDIDNVHESISSQNPPKKMLFMTFNKQNIMHMLKIQNLFEIYKATYETETSDELTQPDERVYIRMIYKLFKTWYDFFLKDLIAETYDQLM